MIEAIQQEKNLRKIFAAAITAVDPGVLMRKAIDIKDGSLRVQNEHIDISGVHNIVLLGAGKAAVAMVNATEKLIGNYFRDGLVVTKYGHVGQTSKSQVIEAGHPIPDENSVMAAHKMTELLKRCGKQDLVIFSLSGGASSLLADLPGNFSLNDLAITFNALSEKGATINELNTIRKHLSRIKGGQLLCYAPDAKFITLSLSDVIGDDPGVIGSGPTFPDFTTFADAVAIVEKYELQTRLPTEIMQYLMRGKEGIIPETIKQSDGVAGISKNFIIGNNETACIAACAAATELGYEVVRLESKFSGDAERLAISMTEMIRGFPAGKKICVIAGGETTVVIKGTGKGGRNQHMALATAIGIDGLESVSVLAAGTDGGDGPTEVAGAIVSGGTVATARKGGLDAQTFLSANDSYHFFKRVGGHVITGPTGTNVMDLFVAVVN